MNALALLIPIALLLGLGGLATFFWALRSGQFEDLEGAAVRALLDQPPDAPDTEAVQDTIDAVPARRHDRGSPDE